MKKIVYVLIAGAMFLASCDNQPAKPNKGTEVVNQEVEVVDNQDQNKKEEPKKEEKNKNNYVNKKCRFSINFPVDQKWEETTADVKTDAGVVPSTNVEYSDGETYSYIASCMLMPQGAPCDLHASAEKFAKAMGGKIVSTKENKFDGQPGLHVKIEGNFNGEVVFVNKDSRNYNFGVMYKDGVVDGKDVKEFINSFRFEEE